MLDIAQRHIDTSQVDVFADGNLTHTECVTSIENGIVLPNLIDSLTGFEVALESIHRLNRHVQPFVAGKHELRESREDHQRITELTPLARFHISLLAPEHIQRSYQCRTLSAIVIESEELETAVILRSQVALYLMLITEHLQFAAGLEKFLGLRSHTVLSQ